MTEKSKFSFKESGIPIAVSDNNYSSVYVVFDGIDFVANNPSPASEEHLIGILDANSELNINRGGNDKIQRIIEHAAIGDKSFDDIMDEWNNAWSSA